MSNSRNHGTYTKRATEMSAEHKRNYDQTRAAVYPGAPTGGTMPTEQIENDKAYYGTLTNQANASETEYYDAYKATAKKPAGKHNINSLTPMQHSTLTPFAATASTDALANANARDQFMTDHPYAYVHKDSRELHEGYANDAYQSASFFDSRYTTHYNGSQGEHEHDDPRARHAPRQDYKYDQTTYESSSSSHRTKSTDSSDRSSSPPKSQRKEPVKSSSSKSSSSKSSSAAKFGVKMCTRCGKKPPSSSSKSGKCSDCRK